MLEKYRKQIDEAVEYLRIHGMEAPEIGIVLGSGLNRYADRIEDAIRISYDDVPNFKPTAIDGHKGEVVYGTVEGHKVIIMAGRFHFYEGYSMNEIVLPTRVMIRLGIRRLIITNASGCINRNFKAGSLMLISDHINLSGTNPLIGPNCEEYGPRFPDMTDTYNRDLRRKLKSAAADIGIKLEEGVYTMMSGPSFETPAEIRFLGAIGADAVGMSSVPEAIVANQAVIEIIGISFLSNMAAGILDKPLSGAEINAASELIVEDFAKVVDLAVGI